MANRAENRLFTKPYCDPERLRSKRNETGIACRFLVKDDPFLPNEVF